jgi:hypothetical protein
VTTFLRSDFLFLMQNFSFSTNLFNGRLFFSVSSLPMPAAAAGLEPSTLECYGMCSTTELLATELLSLPFILLLSKYF